MREKVNLSGQRATISVPLFASEINSRFLTERFEGSRGISSRVCIAPHPLLYYIPPDLQEHNKFAIVLAGNSGDRYLIAKVLPRDESAAWSDLKRWNGYLISSNFFFLSLSRATLFALVSQFTRAGGQWKTKGGARAARAIAVVTRRRA